ncbi:hypothetical protein ACTXG6_19365 [Pseudonocardia sp. Cha107L01]|jgi:hypothetical protein
MRTVINPAWDRPNIGGASPTPTGARHDGAYIAAEFDKTYIPEQRK